MSTTGLKLLQLLYDNAESNNTGKIFDLLNQIENTKNERMKFCELANNHCVMSIVFEFLKNCEIARVLRANRALANAAKYYSIHVMKKIKVYHDLFHLFHRFLDAFKALRSVTYNYTHNEEIITILSLPQIQKLHIIASEDRSNFGHSKILEFSVSSVETIKVSGFTTPCLFHLLSQYAPYMTNLQTLKIKSGECTWESDSNLCKFSVQTTNKEVFNPLKLENDLYDHKEKYKLLMYQEMGKFLCTLMTNNIELKNVEICKSSLSNSIWPYPHSLKSMVAEELDKSYLTNLFKFYRLDHISFCKKCCCFGGIDESKFSFLLRGNWQFVKKFSIPRIGACIKILECSENVEFINIQGAYHLEDYNTSKYAPYTRLYRKFSELMSLLAKKQQPLILKFCGLMKYFYDLRQDENTILNQINAERLNYEISKAGEDLIVWNKK